MNPSIPLSTSGQGPSHFGSDSVGMAVADTSSGRATTTIGPTKSGIPIYPMPVYLKFAPGGISFANSKANTHDSFTTPTKTTSTSTSTNDNISDGTTITESMNDAPYMYNLAQYSYVPPTNGITFGVTTPTTTATSTPSAAASSTTSTSSSSSSSSFLMSGRQEQQQPGMNSPDRLISHARLADDRLQAYIRLFVGASEITSTTTTTQTPIYLPSLSILANAAFGRLTGAPPTAAKLWADAMVLQYYDDDNDEDDSTSNTVHGSTNNDGMTMKEPPRTWSQTEEEVRNMKLLGTNGNGSRRRSSSNGDETTVNLLKRLLLEGQAQEAAATPSSTYRPRPCGYVFKRGDIAWNCRTCQTDSTCVICDNCFRHSDHEGHEVYFHRTTPGGCCDCGDAEAWKVEGCCTQHRPKVDACIEIPVQDDPNEAVRMAIRGREAGIETLRNIPTVLPPRLAATLGVVIGAAVHCLVEAVDGAGIGADPVQWKMRWSDEAARIWNGAPQQEYHHPSRSSAAPPGSGSSASTLSPTWSTPNDFLSETNPQMFPQNFRLQVRLHNDDVHTFEEVIDALHDPRHSRRNPNPDDPISQSLVVERDDATKMTHHVDGDGQVTVKTYSSIASAMIGFRRLKSRGLHCAVVSTAQVDAELRARALSLWLTEISAAHPAAAVLVVHALLQINSSHDLDGVALWPEARSIPPWVAPAEVDDVVACRRRFQAFPPHLASSYVTSDEAELLFEMAIAINATAFLELTGKSVNLNCGSRCCVVCPLIPTVFQGTAQVVPTRKR
jgi:hypothetical protein